MADARPSRAGILSATSDRRASPPPEQPPVTPPVAPHRNNRHCALLPTARPLDRLPRYGRCHFRLTIMDTHCIIAVLDTAGDYSRSSLYTAPTPPVGCRRQSADHSGNTFSFEISLRKLAMRTSG
ncbi:hypothetical protein BHE74_00002217 [Ensete ventricosum]|nr:hypothetical protein BHE74_00002217 [Ensete ventricosum]RZR78699.1 hypothetical protein BHM03_00004121 [Ensete ventricosum]